MANRREENLQKVLTAIEEWSGFPGPSFRDLQGITGISLGTVHNACKVLRVRGLITYEDHIARSIRREYGKFDGLTSMEEPSASWSTGVVPTITTTHIYDGLLYVDASASDVAYA